MRKSTFFSFSAGALVLAIASGIAWAQSSPAKTNWSIKRPYVQFYESPPTIPKPKGILDQEVVRLQGDFKLNTRYSPSSQAIIKAGKMGSKLPALSARMGIIESTVEKNYVPLFESYGLPEPEYGEIIQNKAKSDTRWLFYGDPNLVDALGEHRGGRCDRNMPKRLSGILIDTNSIPIKADVKKEFHMGAVIAHEMLHAAQPSCRQSGWRQEGGPDGYAYHAAWQSQIDKTNIKTLIDNGLLEEIYGLREYYLPLDNNSILTPKWAKAQSLDALGSDGSMDIRNYYTSSYFRYLLEGTKSKTLAYNFFTKDLGLGVRAKESRTKYYKEVKAKLGIDAAQHLAAFFTEYASYGGGRYKYILGATTDDELRYTWNKLAFKCRPQDGILIEDTKLGSRQHIKMPDIMGMSAQCFYVNWKDIKSASGPLKIRLLVNSEEEAKSLWLGQSYLKGATHVKTPKGRHYCYENLTNGGGKYGESIFNNRAAAQLENQCLFRPQAIRKNVKFNGKKYFAVEYVTKFGVGGTGEASFVLTNAARFNTDKTKFHPEKEIDVIVQVQKIRASVKWKNQHHAHLDSSSKEHPQIGTMIANSNDVYFNEGLRASRDIKMGGDMPMADMSEIAGKGAMAILTGEDFQFHLTDAPEGIIGMFMSNDGMKISMGGEGLDESLFADCGIKNDVTVHERSVTGYDVTFEADVIDMMKLMSMAMGSDMDCATVKKAIYDRVAVSVYIPDGQMLMHDEHIELVYPDYYDDYVKKSLNKVGVADLGGLPRMADASTFMTKFSGNAIPGGGGGFDGSFPRINDGDSSSNDGMSSGSHTDSPAVAGTCNTPEAEALLERINAAGKTCECSCSLAEDLGGEMQSVMSDSMGFIMSNMACADPITEASDKASERMQTCLMETCMQTILSCN